MSMMRYTYDYNGMRYTIDAPAGATAADLQSIVDAGAKTPPAPTPQAAPAAPPAQPAPEEERGVLGDLGRAIVRGTGALVGGVARPLEELPAIVDYMTPAGITKRILTPDALEKPQEEAWKKFVSPAAETIREAGAGISGTVAPRATGSMQEEYAKRGLTGAAASIAETVAESIPVTGGAILTGLLTRNPTAAMSVMGLAAPQTYTGIRERQDAEGIDNIGLAVAGTAASTALDMVSGVGGAASRIGREALKDAFQTGIVGAAKQVLRTGREETGTEILQNIIEQTAGGTDPTTKAALLETLEAGLAGALGGVAFGGSIEGVNAGLAARQRAKVADIPALETVEIFAPGTGAPTPVDILSAIGEDGTVVARTPDGNPFRITVEELEKVRTPAAEGEIRAPLSETIAAAAQERTAVEDEGALKREFLQLFREQMQEEMTAQPGLTRDDAYEIVLERAEDIRDAAQASLAAKREGEAGAVPPVDTGVDVVRGVEPSVGTVAEPGRAAPVTGEPAAVDLGGLERPVPSAPAADVGAAAGEPTLAPITSAQVKATVPTIEKAFEDNALDFEDAYGVTKLNAEQKKQAARIILQSPEVDPYDAIGSVLDRGVKIRGETPPARPAPRAAAPADLNVQIDEYTAYAERGEFAPQPLVDAIASQYIDAAAAGVGAGVVSPERIPAFQQFISNEYSAIERAQRAAREAPPTVAETATNAVPKLYHGGRSGMTLDDISIVREPGATKQGKKGRVYGGFYATANPDEAQDYAKMAGEGNTVYEVELRPDAVVEQKDGDITRLTPQQINEYRARGVDVVVGKDIRGRTEHAIINKNAVTGLKDTQAPSTTPELVYTPQQIVDNIQFFARTEAQDRGFDPAMFGEGARDAVRGVEPLDDALILEAQGQEALDAYKAGLQFGRDRVADTQAAPEEAAPEEAAPEEAAPEEAAPEEAAPEEAAPEEAAPDDVEMAARIAAAAPNLTMTQVKRALTAAGLKRQKLDTYMKRLLRSEQASGISNDASRITNLARNQKDGIRTLKGAQQSLFQSKLLPAVLIGLSTRDITDWVGDRIKAVPRINKIVESMMVYRVGKIRKLADIVEEWTAFNRDFNKGAVALDHVAHIATYYNVDPTKARTATAYMAIDAKLQKLLERNAPQRDITRRKNEIRRVYEGGSAEDFGGQVVYGWNDLSKPEFGNGKGKVIFRKAHLAYQANLSEQYNLLIKRIDDAKMDDKDADRAKSFIEKMMENAREQVIYFPHMRHGTYWLSIGKGANSEFHLFDTATKRNAERIRMQEEAARNGEELEFAQGDDVQKLREGIVRKEATGALKKVFDMLGSDNPDIAALRDNIMQMYLNTLPEADMRKHFKRRQFKTGFSLDTLRDFVVAQNAAASQLARLKYANLLKNTISEGYGEIRGKPNEPFLQKFMDEMDIRARAETQPQEVTMVDKAISVGNKIAFVWLMTSPKTALIQFTQLPVVGLSVLSAEFGEAATYATATRYMAGIFAGQKMGISKRDANGNIITRFAAPSIQNSKYLRKMAEKDPTRYEALTYGWDYANTRDMFQETLGADLTDRAKVPSTEYGAWAAAKQGKIGSAIKQGTNAAIDLLGSGMHHTERMSREIMYMSSYELAYDKARKQGVPHRKAMTKAAEQAVNLTYKAMFDYSTYNKPRLMKFQSTRLASSLMTYVYHMTSHLARNFYGMLPLLNKEGKLAAARMFFGTLGMTFLFAGAVGMPLFGFGMAIADIIRRNMGDDDEDEVLRYADENGNPLGKVSTEYWFRAKWIPDTFGPNSDIAAALGLSEENAELLAQAVEKGPVSAVSGLNIGSSLSLNSLWFNTDIKGEGETGMFEYLGMLIAGPFGSVAGRLPRAYNLWMEGKGDRAVETMLPGFAVGGAKAFRFAQEGMLTTTGRKEILPQEFFSPWYTVSQTLGFGPTKGAQLQEQNILMKDVEESVRDRREKLVNRYHDAFDRNITYGNPSSRKKLNDVWKDVETFNANFPNAMITLETLAEGWARRNEEKLRTYGGATFNPDYPAGQYLMETR